jgi:hypothetical protein
MSIVKRVGLTLNMAGLRPKYGVSNAIIPNTGGQGDFVFRNANIKSAITNPPILSASSQC